MAHRVQRPALVTQRLEHEHARERRVAPQVVQIDAMLGVRAFLERLTRAKGTVARRESRVTPTYGGFGSTRLLELRRVDLEVMLLQHTRWRCVSDCLGKEAEGWHSCLLLCVPVLVRPGLRTGRHRRGPGTNGSLRRRYSAHLAESHELTAPQSRHDELHGHRAILAPACTHSRSAARVMPFAAQQKSRLVAAHDAPAVAVGERAAGVKRRRACRLVIRSLLIHVRLGVCLGCYLGAALGRLCALRRRFRRARRRLSCQLHRTLLERLALFRIEDLPLRGQHLRGRQVNVVSAWKLVSLHESKIMGRTLDRSLKPSEGCSTASVARRSLQNTSCTAAQERASIQQRRPSKQQQSNANHARKRRPCAALALPATQRLYTTTCRKGASVAQVAHAATLRKRTRLCLLCACCLACADATALAEAAMVHCTHRSRT